MAISTPVLFLPGTQCDERLWLPLWRLLDLEDRRYVPLQWAETLEQMLSLADYGAEGDRVHLVGFSMGGFIASRFALDNPQQVASLTLIGFDGAGLSQQEQALRQQLVTQLDKGRFKPMTEARLDQMVGQGPNGQGARETVREMEQDLGGSVLKYHLLAASARPDLRPALAKASFPVNIIAAKDDQLAPLAKLEAMHQALAKSRLLVLENSGHMLPLEQPEALAELLTQVWA
ncbi:alpha/beta fold hydrolase [Gallaecimonas xiamenensis]|uniref:Putative hydrolase n=1 Tax=Gallaecimonas xiamenensis 3-C-1 TaxID=745411 RepID=K2JDQ1_9GAMM|nr:alpha/beta hydrolase [Gallaecimonas xiamenensis]EKE68654.1 putative hydrolase [Gallaecimonas xiamenensis 3-C-1]